MFISVPSNVFIYIYKLVHMILTKAAFNASWVCMMTLTVQVAERLIYSDFVGVRFDAFFPTIYTLREKKKEKTQQKKQAWNQTQQSNSCSTTVESQQVNTLLTCWPSFLKNVTEVMKQLLSFVSECQWKNAQGNRKGSSVLLYLYTWYRW